MIEKCYILCRRYSDYAPLAMRLGLGAVFLLFSFQKLSIPGQTTAEIGQIFFKGASSSLGASSVVNFYTGILEGLIGLGLIVGLYARVFAFLASGMVIIIFSSIMLKYGAKNDPNLYRDIGLIGVGIALMLLGAGGFSIDRMIEKKKGKIYSVVLFNKSAVDSDSPEEKERLEGPIKAGEEFKLPPSKLNM